MVEQTLENDEERSQRVEDEWIVVWLLRRVRLKREEHDEKLMGWKWAGEMV